MTLSPPGAPSDHARADADHLRADRDHSGRRGWRVNIAYVLAGTLLLAVGFGVGTAVHLGGAAGPAPATATTPHVLVVMEENKGYVKTLGSCSADPYLCSLAKGYASFTNSHGVSHPSEPNYVAFESGSIGACTTDSSCKAGTVTRVDLGGQLTAKALPWVGWMESMPTPCSKVATSGPYALKHSFGGFFSDEYKGTCHILPYPGITAALATLGGAGAPDFVWITPNLNDDMHDGTVQQGDAWLKANLAPILASTWFTGFTSTVIVTMDEGDSGGANQIPTVVISHAAAGKGAVTTLVNHYAMLRAIEEAYGLTLLGAAVKAPDVLSLFG